MLCEASTLPSATGRPRPRGRAMPAPQSSRRCARRKNGRRSPTWRAGGVERCPPGDGLLSPLEKRGSLGREGFPQFTEAFPSRNVFRVPVFGLHLYGRHCFWGWNIIIPPGYCIVVSPGIVFQYVRTYSSTYNSTAAVGT